MEIFYQILEIINYVVIGICSFSLLFQVVMILFFWLPEKHFKPSDDLARIALVICARNEESVVGETVREIFEKQNYPRDLYDVYVIADNCTDLTAEKAEQAGATVYIHSDEDPKHHCVAYPLAYGLEKIMSGEKKYDIMIRIDADNLLKNDYFRRMSDAYRSGVEIARPFEASRNATQNTWSAVSASYYLRDSFIACNFREFFGMDSMLTGAGMMVAFKVFEEIGGWDSFTTSEDAEFTCRRLTEGRRVHYVADAVVFEDQPSTLKDTHKRNARMGYGLHRVFWREGWRMLGHFFFNLVTFRWNKLRWSDVDLFVQLLVIPVAVLCCVWFPAYYIFYVIGHLVNAIGPEWLGAVTALDGSLLTAEKSMSLLFETFMPMVLAVLGTYIVMYPLQTWIACVRSKKKLGVKSLKGLKRGIFLSPLLMILNAISITYGTFTHTGWESVKRNVVNSPGLSAMQEGEKTPKE